MIYLTQHRQRSYSQLVLCYRRGLPLLHDLVYFCDYAVKYVHVMHKYLTLLAMMHRAAPSWHLWVY
jgi:hypothetical protein